MYIPVWVIVAVIVLLLLGAKLSDVIGLAIIVFLATWIFQNFFLVLVVVLALYGIYRLLVGDNYSPKSPTVTEQKEIESQKKDEIEKWEKSPEGVAYTKKWRKIKIIGATGVVLVIIIGVLIANL